MDPIQKFELQLVLLNVVSFLLGVIWGRVIAKIELEEDENNGC